ncbi:hypothetical protein GCM10007205_00010 [Oxalicibacterium flavum]|uniref:Uncharacterized protein n=1 Tax=Oxalicibacterium flavum TaxID=179467 RepID=A0A8J2XWX5_9BURK|nr:hypothetical protein [Oxalicibacterium flavum]GGB94753.1 hypothetical protein GCM10007205_00010 [Oxalicibacterium flavum]
MATFLFHRETRIVTLGKGEYVLDHCLTDDIALIRDPLGWWVCIIGDDHNALRCDTCSPTHEAALKIARSLADYCMA